MARQFSSTTKIDVSGVFRCSSTCKATDSGSKCMLAKTIVLVPNLRTVVISENGVRIGFWPLTTAKVKILQYNSCWQSNSNGNAGIKKISTTTLEKQSNQSRPTRRQFTLDDKNSTFDHENRIATLTFTAKCWQFALRDENASFSAKLRWNVDNPLSRRRTKIISLRTRFQTNHARQLRTDLPQKSIRYDVANSRYHFHRRKFDETIKFASSIFKK